MELPWDSHSQWDSQSHAHLYLVTATGTQYNRQKMQRTWTLKFLEVVRQHTSDVVSNGFDEVTVTRRRRVFWDTVYDDSFTLLLYKSY